MGASVFCQVHEWQWFQTTDAYRNTVVSYTCKKCPLVKTVTTKYFDVTEPSQAERLENQQLAREIEAEMYKT